MRKAAVWVLFLSLLGLAGVTARAAQAARFRPSVRTALSAGSATRLGAAVSAPENGGGEEESHHEALFKVINFVILVGALWYLLRKPLAGFFTQRSGSIRQGLEEGRKALEASQAQLRAVEEKLQGLQEEITRFKADSAKEMDAERERMRRAGAIEAERIVQFAQVQIESAMRAAKLELKSYAARQAVDLAEQTIRQRLDEAGHRQLVDRFVRELSQKPN